MPISRRRFAAGALAGLAGYLPSRLQALPKRPKLFIFVIAEQFRQLYLDRAGNNLGTAGFRELMAKGVYYPDCRFAASGFTGTGLATLATGAHPSLHGIVADQWYDRRTHSLTKARADLLDATTLADEVARAGNSRVFCLGLNEGSASLLAGHSPGKVYWMDTDGQFSTRGNTPEWLAAHNALQPIEKFHDRKWMALGATGDFPPLRALTYDPRRPEEFFALYQSSPFCQEAQFDLLRALIAQENLGLGPTLDFVFLSLGSMALLGYETGSSSPLFQLMDQMALQLDFQLQRTMETLNKGPWKNAYNLIFAAAHGAPPVPDPAARAQKAISGESLAHAIAQALSERLDKGDKGTSGAAALAKNAYVDKYVYPFLYLKLETLQKQNIPLRDARKLAGEAALRVPGVAGYYTADGDCSHAGEWRRRFENSFHQLRSGDVMLSYDPEDVEDFSAGRGVSYGSLYNYDTSVPLFLYGPQFGKKLIERAIAAVDLAPTVARAASIATPSSSTGEVLAEAFAEGDDEHPK
jgi:hypothetical protein